MRLTVLLRRASGASRFEMSWVAALSVVSFTLIGLLGVAFTAGLSLGERAAGFRQATPSDLATLSAEQKAELDRLRARVQERIDSLAARMGQVNAHVIRLDALGKRLVEMADIDSKEFDFDVTPAIGGPESEGLPAEVSDLGALFDNLETRLSRRDTQLAVLEQVIMQRELRAQIVPEGRPVQRGFLSSAYGMRTDPFTGRNAFHRGIDFAGNTGDPVIAVGAGVVTYVGRRVGYGYVVDVSHGDGFVTRYAHNSAVTVTLGETVTRGQQLALMGSTGRSTGPHVHFEVLRNGRPVNPLSYLGG